VKVFKMTTVSFMAPLTTVSNWQKSGHQSCSGKAAQTVQFLAGAPEVLLALCCTPPPSRNPTRKSQERLSLAIVGSIQHIRYRPINRSEKMLSKEALTSG
jgi:hypothetical protein